MNQLPDVLVVVRQPCLWPPEQQHLVLSAPNIGQQKDLLKGTKKKNNNKFFKVWIF